jgi:hypothetical protein
LGTVLWISFYAAVIVGTCQKQKLEEDLANKPTESFNQAMQPQPLDGVRVRFLMTNRRSFQTALALPIGG